MTSNRIPLEFTQSEKELGVFIDKELKFSYHTQSQVNKANQILGMIRCFFVHLDTYSFQKLFVALVRPHLEYGNVVYHPQFLKDKRSTALSICHLTSHQVVTVKACEGRHFTAD